MGSAKSEILVWCESTQNKWVVTRIHSLQAIQSLWLLFFFMSSFVDDSELYPVTSARYLELVFDKDLSWKVYVSAVVKKNVPER